jgi:hypothetical protein
MCLLSENAESGSTLSAFALNGEDPNLASDLSRDCFQMPSTENPQRHQRPLR